jgi:hypothetical protein
MPIRILRLSPALRDRLLGAPPDAGSVHSVFDRALNIQWHDRRLITLHGPGPLAAPFAASIAHLPDPGSIPAGAPVYRRGRFLQIRGVVLDVQDGESVDTKVPPTDAAPEPLPIFLSSLEGGPIAPGLSSPSGIWARQRLFHGIRQRHMEAFIEGACALVGLGEGLTPAGDDCLVGALAILHRFAGSWLTGHSLIGSRLAAAANVGTTVVGREFILYALDGTFSEILILLVTANTAEQARGAAGRLLEVGGTSGGDTLDGVRLTLDALCGREQPFSTR